MLRAAPITLSFLILSCDRAKADPVVVTDPGPLKVETATVAAAPPPPVDPRRYVSLEIQSSLEASVVRATDGELGPKLTQVAKRVLVWWLDPRRDMRRGDRMELVYETRGEEEPLVHAIWFQSEKLGRQLSAVRHQPEGGEFARYYELDGREVEQRLVGGPIGEYEQVTSLLNDGRGHRGVDFKAPVGTAIRSPFDGYVVRRNWATRRNGNCLQIETSKGLHAYFLHLSSIAKGVRPGTRVKKGQVLARSGNTGRSSAPHLHYQLERGGRIVDPFRIHPTERKRLSPEEVERVKATVNRLASYRTGAM